MMHGPLRFLPRILWKGRAPLHLTYFVTSRCNSRCGFCFYRKEAGAAGDELRAGEAERIARAYPGNLLWLLLSGGEPFLHPEVSAICRSFYRHTRPTFIVIPTNCLQPRTIEEAVERITRECPRSQVVIKASLDGWGADHDRLRGVDGNFELFRETVDRIGALKAGRRNLSLGVNTVVLPQNIGRLSDLRREVRRLPCVDYHNFSLVRGAPAAEELKEIDPESYRLFGEDLKAEARRGEGGKGSFFGAQLKAAQDIRQRELVYRVLVTGKRQIPCYAGRLNLVLNETGDVYPCEMLPWKLGNVREEGYDLGKILAGTRTDECLKAITEGNAVCDRCTNECYFITNILFNLPQAAATLLLAVRNLAGESAAAAAAWMSGSGPRR